jgi:hypothetical protein
MAPEKRVAILPFIKGNKFKGKRVWCNGSIPVSKTVDGSSNLSTRASVAEAENLSEDEGQRRRPE